MTDLNTFAAELVTIILTLYSPLAIGAHSSNILKYCCLSKTPSSNYSVLVHSL